VTRRPPGSATPDWPADIMSCCRTGLLHQPATARRHDYDGASPPDRHRHRRRQAYWRRDRPRAGRRWLACRHPLQHVARRSRDALPPKSARRPSSPPILPTRMWGSGFLPQRMACRRSACWSIRPRASSMTGWKISPRRFRHSHGRQPARAGAHHPRLCATAVPAGVTGLVVNLLDAKLEGLNPDYFTYTLSKIGLHGLTELTARTYAPQSALCRHRARRDVGQRAAEPREFRSRPWPQPAGAGGDGRPYCRSAALCHCDADL
jgi:hypothetical protein